MTRLLSNNRGATLVELLVTLLVGMIVLSSIYLAVNTAQKSTAGIERKVVAQQDIRGAIELMAMEIRMASYNPRLTTGNWRNPTVCSQVSANQTYGGIQEATATNITIEMDLNGNCSGNNNATCMTGSDDPNEVIQYVYNAAEQRITRETNCGGAQPFLGDRATSGSARTVRVLNDGANPVFRYFNGAGADITATLPAGIPNIQRIMITLVAATAEIDPSTGRERRLVYTTSVVPRNHVPHL